MTALDIAVGAKASRSLTITADHVKQFTEITGDYNPLHFDARFASPTRPTTTSAARLSGSSLTSRFPSAYRPFARCVRTHWGISGSSAFADRASRSRSGWSLNLRVDGWEPLRHRPAFASGRWAPSMCSVSTGTNSTSSGCCYTS